MSPGFVWPLQFVFNLASFCNLGDRTAPRAPRDHARDATATRTWRPEPGPLPALTCPAGICSLVVTFRAVQPALGWWKTVLTHRGHRGRAAASARSGPRRSRAAARAQRTRSEPAYAVRPYARRGVPNNGQKPETT